MIHRERHRAQKKETEDKTQAMQSVEKEREGGGEDGSQGFEFLRVLLVDLLSFSGEICSKNTKISEIQDKRGKSKWNR